MTGAYGLMARLLYGTGMRLMECVWLRVDDVDFALHQITVRDGKGSKGRVTMLPRSVAMPLRAHLVQVYSMHETDLIRTVQDLPGHSDVSTTMIYTHVLNRGPRGVVSPLD